MTSPSLLLAAANLLDIASYAEHRINCPEWYVRHGVVHLATQGKPCDCGLDEQLEAVRVMAEYVRSSLTSAKVLAVRVEYHCTGNEHSEAGNRSAVFNATRSDNAQPASEFVERLRTRSCCTLLRVVHTLAVEVAATPETP